MLFRYVEILINDLLFSFFTVARKSILYVFFSQFSHHTLERKLLLTTPLRLINFRCPTFHCVILLNVAGNEILLFLLVYFTAYFDYLSAFKAHCISFGKLFLTNSMGAWLRETGSFIFNISPLNINISLCLLNKCRPSDDWVTPMKQSVMVYCCC